MKRIEFAIPKGYTPPEGMTEWDQIGTFRIKPDGKTMCLIAIGGTPLPGYENHKDLGAEAGANTAARYREKMTGMEGGAASSGGTAY